MLSRSWGPFYVRIYVHMIVRNDNSGGYEEPVVREAINLMKADFIERNIFFVWENCAIDRILNSTLYNTGVFLPIEPDPFLTTITSYNPNPDGIDIYLLPASHPCNGGKASGIPGKALALGGSFWLPPYTPFLPSRVLSHEMGHCLGRRWLLTVLRWIRTRPLCCSTCKRIPCNLIRIL